MNIEEKKFLAEWMGYHIEEEEGFWPNVSEVLRDSKGNRVCDFSNWNPDQDLEQFNSLIRAFPFRDYCKLEKKFPNMYYMDPIESFVFMNKMKLNFCKAILQVLGYKGVDNG